MITGNSFAKSVWIRSTIVSLTLGLLLLPSSRTAHAARLHDLAAVPQSAQSQSDADQERQDREQEKRDREQEARDREQEKRDREQEKLERLQELYDDGQEALDDEHFEQALSKYTELVKLNGPQTDAALYWKAYSENKLGRKAAALASIAEIKSKYAQSRYKKDAEVLELEVKQSSGVKTNPENEPDDLKAMALRAIWQSDPERALPVTDKILNGSGSPKYKANILFVAAQSGSPQAAELMTRIARGQANPELQRKAVEYLSMFGGDKAHKTLSELYASTSDEGVKRAIIRSHLLNGDKASLFAEAKNEKSEALRKEAIRTLGLTGGTSELDQLYKSETSSDVKREILQAFFLAGDSSRMEQAAMGEKDPELRRAAIRNLGLMGKSDLLQSIYAKETDYSLKEEVLNSYFLSGNAKALIAVAKSEKDASLKKKAVEKLSLMGSKEGNDYLMELLNK
ncbi:MAG: HEAT repeat domain-containing protein [Acidobacteria bacterium]|nr:HEAT repeat domain-containing protein [Acidobacteriota bacterium]MBS1865610.1 HEAT repeat domain-containing protein [Acidobacteriota bacterium]